MIKIEKTEVLGWEHVIRGMRNPMNSWEQSDSYCKEPCHKCPDHSHCDFYFSEMGTGERYRSKDHVGPKDHELMMKLANGGSVHAKYRRMIIVYLDITAPLYWWKEFDTYKVGTVANSCSTMHKIHDKEFTLDDFSHEHLSCWGASTRREEGGDIYSEPVSAEEIVPDGSNDLRSEELKPGERGYLQQEMAKFWKEKENNEIYARRSFIDLYSNPKFKMPENIKEIAERGKLYCYDVPKTNTRHIACSNDAITIDEKYEIIKFAMFATRLLEVVFDE